MHDEDVTRPEPRIWRGISRVLRQEGARCHERRVVPRWPSEAVKPTLLALAILAGVAARVWGQAPPSGSLPGTRLLEWGDDIASRMVAGADRFLLEKIEASTSKRAKLWDRDWGSPTAYESSLEPNRRRLAHILGARDSRHGVESLSLVGTTSHSPVVGENEHIQVRAVRWPVVGRIHGEGLLLMPRHGEPVANVVAIPDADQTPESICGLIAGVETDSQFARRLAEAGCRVLVPMLIDREVQPRNGRAELTTREYLYRSAFELGRHIIGYELQKILAGVDWFEHEAGVEDARIGVMGWGEGGMLTLYAAALDTRIDVACVSGYFEPREAIWRQPIDRNVFGLLEQFGDAELASMIAPRRLIVEAARGPELTLPPGKGGAPGRLETPSLKEVRDEFERANRLVEKLPGDNPFQLVVSDDGDGAFLTDKTLKPFLQQLVPHTPLPPSRPAPEYQGDLAYVERRAEQQAKEIDRHNQWLLRESAYVRADFMKDLDTSSLKAFERSVANYRTLFREQIIGHFPQPLKPANPRSRKAYESQAWTGHEVVLDVFPDLFAYGILLLPNDLQPGERRPVVVCQHGLEGRPQQVVKGNHRAYHDFAAKLAERGFITFAPQNLYIFGDRFRTLQRKANPLKKTLFSLMVPQHRRIVDWLSSLDGVDPDRIAFYGLSYGGKSAMRIPPLVDGYCLSICSADFNEWIWKNASTRAPHSYVWTKEYEIFEFDLGSTFNYAEMATLIAPRPFMVERGHFDGVAPDEKVAHEFAKVRRLYAARLGIPDRCAIEWFVGPHEINGEGTFAFLHEHLDWPVKK
ncbi:MAG: dienelactone hydrolase family protein [Planctomycetota bacterium]